MPFQKGKPRAPGAGRKPGSTNKRTAQFEEVLAKHNFCAASAMIEIFNESKKIYESYAEIYAAISEAREIKGLIPLEEKADKYLKIAGDMACEIASYAYPKRKAVETTVDPGLLEMIKNLEGKSTEELLDLLKIKPQS